MPEKKTDHSKTLPIVFTIILVDMLGVGILIPIIPLLLTDPAYPYHLPIAGGNGYVILGLLTAIYPFMQFIATPILGQISDRVGRKPVLAFSLAGTALSYVVFALGIITKNIPLLFASRALDGITGGNISVAQAAIADVTEPAKRARAFGIIGAAFGIGFIIGPFLGGRLADPSIVHWFNATTPFWFAAIVSLINMIAVLMFFKETLAHKATDAIHWAQSFINIQKAALNPKLRSLFGTSFLFQSGFTFFTTFFGVYLIAKFGFNQAGIGDFFALVGICVAITQAVITPFAAKRFKPFTIIVTALFGVSVTLLLFYLSSAAWMLYLITIPNAMFIGLIMANLTALISRQADQRQQGEVLGINASVQALAQAIPPVIAGYVAASIRPDAPLLVASIIVVIAALTFLRTGPRTQAAHS
jgi:DHA1 family tetracycline resistance protein-like MFS transporter